MLRDRRRRLREELQEGADGLRIGGDLLHELARDTHLLADALEVDILELQSAEIDAVAALLQHVSDDCRHIRGLMTGGVVLAIAQDQGHGRDLDVLLQVALRLGRNSAEKPQARVVERRRVHDLVLAALQRVGPCQRSELEEHPLVAAKGVDELGVGLDRPSTLRVLERAPDQVMPFDHRLGVRDPLGVLGPVRVHVFHRRGVVDQERDQGQVVDVLHRDDRERLLDLVTQRAQEPRRIRGEVSLRRRIGEKRTGQIGLLRHDRILHFHG